MFQSVSELCKAYLFHDGAVRLLVNYSKKLSSWVTEKAGY